MQIHKIAMYTPFLLIKQQITMIKRSDSKKITPMIVPTIM